MWLVKLKATQKRESDRLEKNSDMRAETPVDIQII